MYYYRYDNAEINCCYKYLMFSYNIIFWVSLPHICVPVVLSLTSMDTMAPIYVKPDTLRLTLID